MTPVKNGILMIFSVAIIILLYSSVYIVTEGQQAILTQFGRPVGKPTTEAGAHFKLPLIQDVRYVDKRILTWDGDPNEIPTKDKKFIHVDTTARWRIIDALKFIQTVQNERGAITRLDAILDGITRDTISNYNLVEAVRNSNAILDRIQIAKQDVEKREALGEVVEEEVTGEIEPVSMGREKLSDIIAKSADEETQKYGISIIDVQLRRISYEKSVEAKVYERMISERRRIAEKIRSYGKAEKAKIEGRLGRDLQQIESKAYQASQTIRGQGDAKASAIYAQSLSKDPSFYEFLRTMEAYRNSLKSDTEFILSSDSEFLRLLKSQK
jgi:membrane protease subunit HflC